MNPSIAKPPDRLARNPRLVVFPIWCLALGFGAAEAGALQAPGQERLAEPVPYAAEEVAYRNPTDGVRLSGTLTVPVGPGPFPAVLLVSGAGPQGRDYEVFGHRPFLVLADHLSRRGIAVLRLDDRGAGESGGDAGQASVSLVVEDLRAGVDFLRRHGRIDPARVGLVAHSQGARIAPEAARRVEGIAFLVLLAPPAMPARELAAAQTEAALLVSKDPGVRLQAALVARLRELLRDQPDPVLATRALFAGWDAWAATEPPEVGRLLGMVKDRPGFSGQVERLAGALGSPWNRELYELDPGPALRSIRVPVLALYGDRDRQAPPEPNVEALRAAWRAREDVTIRVLPGLNHFFQHAETGMMDEVPGLEESFAAEALDAISGWLAERTAR
ncbi:MAG: alpha/beta fold hydrolase [Gemmatimonadales bacterium]